jgi:Domain of unknown function (DUF4829)
MTALALAACGSSVALDHLGSRELVMTYYSSLEKGDTSTARQCLAPSFASLEDSSPDSDFANLQSIRNVTVGEDRQESTAGTAFQNYYELREMPVGFDAIYKQVITGHSGHVTAFVIVGKESKDSPWRIVSIGSGP